MSGIREITTVVDACKEYAEKNQVFYLAKGTGFIQKIPTYLELDSFGTSQYPVS